MLAWNLICSDIVNDSIGQHITGRDGIDMEKILVATDCLLKLLIMQNVHTLTQFKTQDLFAE